MIVNPDARRILCYGDSNTWGQRPDKKGRFALSVRWTSLLQYQLGNGYEIIEEGLNGRTTDLESSRRPGRNGMVYFRPCVESQSPLDLIIVMLGTNDLKVEYGPRSAGTIGAALQEYVYIVRTLAETAKIPTPKIALVSPIHIVPAAVYKDVYNEQSAGTSRLLAAEVRNVADRNNPTRTIDSCFFADASTVATPGEDGIHMDNVGHKAFADYLAAKVIGEWLV